MIVLGDIVTESIFTNRIKSGLREQAWTIHDNVTEVDAYANPPESDTSLNVTELADHLAKRLAYLIDDIRIVTRKGSSMDPEWWRAAERLNVQLNLRPAIELPEES